MNYSFRATLTATVAAGALLALSAALSPASAAFIASHTGLAEGLIPGSGEVEVLLLPDFLNVLECDDEGACLGKLWGPGSEDDEHSMVLTDFHGASSFEFSEIVINVTGVAWTDYHVDVVGGIFAEILIELWEFVDGSFIGISTTEGFDLEFDDDSIWVFFDQPLLAMDVVDGDGYALRISTIINLEPDGTTVTINQHPSIGVPEPASLALFGFGLLGLGAMRRRRKKTG